MREGKLLTIVLVLLNSPSDHDVMYQIKVCFIIQFDEPLDDGEEL